MFSDNNLFNPAWTTGSLNAIAPIVRIVGWFAVGLISIGGFFMVILPIMRNVINGIVVVAPNLCEKIDQAHRNKIGLKQVEGGNQIQMVVGSVSNIVLSMFPNFKAMSDFNDGVRDPKSYMMRAIPAMCIYVFIGVFVFYGYPAKVAEKFSGAATSFIDMALNNVDPVAWVEKIPTNLARPDFSSDDASDVLGKNIYTMSKKVYSAFTSKYSEMSKDNRVSLSHEIEAWVDGKLSEITEHSESPKYNLKVECRVTDYNPSLMSTSEWPTPSYDDKENIYTYQVKAPVTGTFSVGIPGGTEGDYFMCTLKFYELPDKNDNGVVECNATVKSELLKSSQTTSTVYLPTGIFSANVNSGITINGYKSSGQGSTQDRDGLGECYVFKFDTSTENLTSGAITGVTVRDGSDRFKMHPIKNIKFSGNSYTFEPIDTTQYGSWSAGGSPKELDAKSED